MCNKKFTYLNSGWSDLNNYYSKKELLNNLVGENKTCYGDYSIFTDDHYNYSVLWSNENNNNSILNSITLTNLSNSSSQTFINSMQNSMNFNPNLSSVFKFTKTKFLKDSAYLGLFSNYPPGGYVYRMQGDLQTVSNNLLALQSIGWLDHRTRAVFFDFTLFNPNINLFAYCSFAFEILPTGTVIPNVDIRAMNFWSTNREVLATGCLAAYLVVIAILMAKEIKSYLALRKKYFKQFWIYVDWTLFAISWTALPMFLYKVYAQHELMSYVDENQISYINLNNLVGWNNTLSMLLSFTTFIASIKLIRLLRFNKKLAYLTDTIKGCVQDLTSFMVVFLLLLTAFSQLMFIIYNDKTLGQATFIKSLTTSFLIILGKFNLGPMIQQDFTVGAIIFVSYNVIIVMIMSNVIVTIISDKFSQSRNLAKKVKEYSMFDHIKRRMKSKLPVINKNKIYMQDTGINYTGYKENAELLEIYSKKLVDNLKEKIYNESNQLDENEKFEKFNSNPHVKKFFAKQ